MKRNYDTPMSQPLTMFLTSLSMLDADTPKRNTNGTPTMKELLNNPETTKDLLESR